MERGAITADARNGRSAQMGTEEEEEGLELHPGSEESVREERIYQVVAAGTANRGAAVSGGAIGGGGGSERGFGVTAARSGSERIWGGAVLVSGRYVGRVSWPF
jgi:hypothetical protein